MTQTYSIADFRENLAQIIGRVMYGGEQAIIKKYNQKAAVLVNSDDYARMIDPSLSYSEKDWQRLFAPLLNVAKRNKNGSYQKIQKDVSQAIQEVRQKQDENTGGN